MFTSYLPSSSSIRTYLHYRLDCVRAYYFHLQALAHNANVSEELELQTIAQEVYMSEELEGADRDVAANDDAGIVDTVWPRRKEDVVVGMAVNDVLAMQADIERDIEKEVEAEALAMREADGEKVETLGATMLYLRPNNGEETNSLPEKPTQRDRRKKRMSLCKGDGERKFQGTSRTGSGQGGILRFLFPGMVGVNPSNGDVRTDKTAQPAIVELPPRSSSPTFSTSDSLVSTSTFATTATAITTTTAATSFDDVSVPSEQGDDVPLHTGDSTLHPVLSVALMTQTTANEEEDAATSHEEERYTYAYTYPPSKHAYAARALLELDAVVHEHGMWAYEVKEWERRAGTAAKTEQGIQAPQVPPLLVEWPKYWNWEKGVV
ncbi:hypothetical protein BC936DRAFT_142519 [Jimgerdemannia flammicorona]|uniref:Uncharacterized protein n=1 Tax=Jimgerdemannia flammicorona TaxID=994334 RepID=A0A433A086_9FUNG|nr:hypothetical protein BC936DRAFT_142519 [Jimgerdemannia flammicorona]